MSNNNSPRMPDAKNMNGLPSIELRNDFIFQTPTLGMQSTNS